jgi:hypothetical protein
LVNCEYAQHENELQLWNFYDGDELWRLKGPGKVTVFGQHPLSFLLSLCYLLPTLNFDQIRQKKL